MLKFLNPWVILAFVLALGGAYGYGIHTGKGLEQAARAKELSLEERIQQTLAGEVAKIKIINRPKIEKLETITREVPVYSQCEHTDDALRLLNDILTGKTTVRPGDSVVPAADAPAR